MGVLKHCRLADIGRTVGAILDGEMEAVKARRRQIDHTLAAKNGDSYRNFEPCEDGAHNYLAFL